MPSIVAARLWLPSQWLSTSANSGISSSRSAMLYRSWVSQPSMSRRKRRTEFATCSRSGGRGPERLSCRSAAAFKLLPLSHWRTRPGRTGRGVYRGPMAHARRNDDRSAEFEIKSDDTGRGLDDIESERRGLAGCERRLRQRDLAQVFACGERARAEHAPVDVRQAHHQSRPSL